MINFLITLGGISLAMSVVIILMLALQKPIKKRFTAVCRYIIWSVIIIRLCIPVSLNIIPSLITLPREEIKTEVTQDLPLTQSEQNIAVGEKTEIHNTPAPNNTPSLGTPEPQKGFELTEEHIVTALFFVWAAGALVFIAMTLVNYITNARTLDKSLRHTDSNTLNKYMKLCENEGIKRIPSLYISSVATSPMVYGFIKPKVILPDMDFEKNSLDCILRHELVHYSRHDLIIKLISMLANALHWFNPLVYMACTQHSVETELSCDEVALEMRSASERLDYGSSMLEIVKRCKGVPKLTTGFNPKKKAVKERFESIVDQKRRNKGYLLVVVALVAVFLAGGLIGYGAAPKADKEVKKTTDEITLFENTEEVNSGYFEYSTNDPDWSFYYDTDKLIMKHTDGRSFGYSQRSAGDYLIDFSPYGESSAYAYFIYDKYALIKYDIPRYDTPDEVRQGLVAVELKGGRIVDRLELTSEHFIVTHSLPIDIFSGYAATAGYAPGFKISVADIQLKNSLIQPVYVFLETNDGNYTLSVLSNFDLDTGRFSELEPSQGIDYYPVNVVTDISQLSSMEDILPSAVETVKAFLNKDIDAIVDFGGYGRGSHEEYRTLVFGDYTISRIADGRLRLDVDILQSGVDGLEVGRHTFIYQNFFTSYMEHACGHYSHVQSNKAVEFLEDWIMINGYTDMPYGLSDSARYSPEKRKIFEYLAYKYPDLDAEGYNKMAQKIFGCSLKICFYLEEGVELEEKVSSDGYLYDEDGTIYTDRPSFGRGGGYCVYDLLETTVEGDVHTAKIQFYNDFAKTLKACVVTFKVKIDGDDICLMSEPEITDDTGRSIPNVTI